MNEKHSSGVELKNVVMTFGEQTVLHNINLMIQPGSLTTLLGPSGCGKTTILRLIAGLELPTSGQVFLGDEDVSVLSASQRDVGMVFQSYALFPHMTVGENVGYGLKMMGIAPDDRTIRIKESLDSVGLDGYQSRFIDQLSGGQQQRVALARALVLKPKVMLFDEPLSNLDSKLRRQMREDIRRLQQELAVTAVYVTHDQDEALAVSDEVVVMKEGGIAQQGSPKHLYLSPNSRFVATFMGDANIVEGEIISAEGKSIIKIGEIEIEADHSMESYKEGKTLVAIRPEALSLIRSTTEPSLKGTVISRAYIGASTEYRIKVDDKELFLISPTGSEEFELDEAVHVLITPPGIAPIPD
ncbi:MAG: ATP-binding cassette domain-containing protein [Gammaproteobacteria bacterium]|jgi:iron(III) transport system ATP-binding protein|nr:ATP-binding cassette domain-containing protein [Gammaproteobacteria bacterium]MBT3725141.1 ATP-binding cassette domain-containing protein [Gammaproteobacteria bacterium]MBT4193291.1 ATP-binding cassette domain-containing protein [Gammaproteobacteria bacterium]MBT4449249.1 ATP-binding cassette domain-containing protein [Gammaproteobacteria bacterium]MBT4862136.1 ATP-binding cassette domain-containing protein [Gammaproteobacteria bacterium]